MLLVVFPNKLLPKLVEKSINLSWYSYNPYGSYGTYYILQFQNCYTGFYISHFKWNFIFIHSLMSFERPWLLSCNPCRIREFPIKGEFNLVEKKLWYLPAWSSPVFLLRVSVTWSIFSLNCFLEWGGLSIVLTFIYLWPLLYFFLVNVILGGTWEIVMEETVSLSATLNL